jgi:hypothetical protein
MSSNPQDALGLNGNSAMAATLAAWRLDPANKDALYGVDAATVTEEVIWTRRLPKINRKGKKQDRDLVLTSLALYNFKPGKYKVFQRRMALPDLDKIFVLKDSADFVLHFSEFSGEYDYRFSPASPEERTSLVDAAKSAYHAITGTTLGTLEIEDRYLESLVTTKASAKAKAEQSQKDDVGKATVATRRASVALRISRAESGGGSMVDTMGAIGEGEGEEDED